MNARWLIPTLTALALAAPVARAQQAPPVHRAPTGSVTPQVAPLPDDDDALAWLGGYDEPFDGPMLLDDQEGGGPGPMGGAMGRGPGGAMRGRGAMGPRRWMRAGMRMRLASLGLTTEQRDKLQGLRDDARRKTIPMQADLALARLDLARMLRADHPQAAAVNAQIDKMARIRADMAKARMASRLEARNVFTPEQWKKLHEPPAFGRRPAGSDGGREGDGGTE